MTHREELRALMCTPTPTAALDDADVIQLAGRDWVAVHTPGHTHDHLCLFDPAEGLLLSGDHVLPTITPHISGMGTAADPLARVLRLARPDARPRGRHASSFPPTATPSPTSTAGSRPSRTTTRSGSTCCATASAELGRPATVQELSTHLFSPRAQGPMADSETYAHLEHLRLAGDAEVTSVDGRLSTPMYDVACAAA